jgi:hypothetical protein
MVTTFVGQQDDRMRGVVFVILLLGALTACGGEVTRVRVVIDGDAGLGIESYQLKVEDRMALAEPRDVLEILLPDEMADTTVMVELWGLRAGSQVAYGSAVATPTLHGTVEITLALTATTCGTWCQPGTVACAENGTITCEQTDDGCAAWSAVTPCPTDAPFCSNGACAATCSDECMTGQTACDGASAVRTCGQFDADSCLDWSPATACGSNQTCAAGACSTTQACSNGSACDDGNACTTDDTCSSGMCSGEQTTCGAQPTQCESGYSLRVYPEDSTCSPTTGECSGSFLYCQRGCLAGACLVQASAGADSSCAIKSNGTLSCWGDMANATLPPVAVYTSVDVAYYHACARKATGAVACWSRDTFGNTWGECDVPSGTYDTVAVGSGFTCAIRSTGTLACWGLSTNGKTTPPTGTFKAVSLGDGHACAIRTDGTLACWGGNGAGESTPPSGAFASVSAGYGATCGVRVGGALACWGNVTFAPPTTGTFVSVAMGRTHACAVRTDGTAKCWGSNSNGQSTPPSGTFSTVSVGETHSCGMRGTGSVACWGSNAEGQTNVPAGL